MNTREEKEKSQAILHENLPLLPYLPISLPCLSLQTGAPRGNSERQFTTPKESTVKNLAATAL